MVFDQFTAHSGPAVEHHELSVRSSAVLWSIQLPFSLCCCNFSNKRFKLDACVTKFVRVDIKTEKEKKPPVLYVKIRTPLNVL